MKYDAFIGRWVIFHNGHLTMIKQVYNKNKRPVLILIMDTDEEPRAEERAINISKVLDSLNIKYCIQSIPPIASINWGRNVGYETNYIQVDKETQKISGTEIRQKIQNHEQDWKKMVP